MVMRATAIVGRTRTQVEYVGLQKRRTRYPHQHVDRNGLGMLGQAREGGDHADAILTALAHAHDATTAHVDAGLANMRQCVEAIPVGARGDDRAVKFGRRIKVVIVVVEACGLQPLSSGRRRAFRAWHRSRARAL